MAGAQCCQNPPALNSAAGEEGAVVDDFGGLKAYAVGSPKAEFAILFVSDIFGFKAPILRKLADKVAAAGFFVVVPDFFHDDPFVPDKLPIMTWLQSHSVEKGFEEAKPVIEALKSKGVSAIGAAGYCWGAKVVGELAKSGDIKAAVMLHPSFVTVDDIKETKAHLAVLGAEIDHISPPALLKQFEEVLAAKSEVDGYVKIFPGVEHGWTVRYDTDDETAVKKAEEAYNDMLEWFLKYLK